jgi:hypothetical protein
MEVAAVVDLRMVQMRRRGLVIRLLLRLIAGRVVERLYYQAVAHLGTAVRVESLLSGSRKEIKQWHILLN